MPPLGTSKLQDKSSSIKTENSVLQNLNFLHFCRSLLPSWILIQIQSNANECESGSGSTNVETLLFNMRQSNQFVGVLFADAKRILACPILVLRTGALGAMKKVLILKVSNQGLRDYLTKT